MEKVKGHCFIYYQCPQIILLVKKKNYLVIKANIKFKSFFGFLELQYGEIFTICDGLASIPSNN